jgi:ketosteroid isomerase-like protein
MSQENVDTVYRLYEASRRRDKEACVRESDIDVEIVSYLMGLEGNVYKGHDGVRRYIDDLFSVFPDWHPQILQASDYGDTVLAEITMAGRGSGSGVAVEQTVWQATRFDHAKMVRFTGYGSRADAIEAEGLAE